jgi:hypothetical protein
MLGAREDVDAVVGVDGDIDDVGVGPPGRDLLPGVDQSERQLLKGHRAILTPAGCRPQPRVSDYGPIGR